ncbi:prolyl oligopeptidase family serine peptidase [Phenylobacterium sp.]|jgi:dipeptidyl aminopeptidase/acylaminoacyl peptidase|uniref:prolyl oligopeptidase family serine peptidase n=1 Tax=Phenylobacterium sp. TaxID=1871053 RepID=UPI002E348A09|nr:prolyl oligopeptidase family serine peptidase [Phenylobacterium sp.]HEX3367797.1 prolyl oligopeptidase family serine peptidase [Phenylobacterium sp.]
MRNLWVGAALGVAMLAAGGGARAADSFTVADAIAYPFTLGLVSAEHADRIAWVRDVKGVRNLWAAEGPDFTPRQVTQFTADDGQELTQLTFSPDGKTLVFVRGGDHDGNWPAAGNLSPDPALSADEPKVTLWLADPTGAKPAVKIVEGDAPAISSKGELAYLKDGVVWTAKMDGTGAKKLFFDRGKDSELSWSPDGTRLAFSSLRDGDHGFIGLYSGADQPVEWLAPSTGIDREPVWSPDGKQVAFTRQPGRGGAPQSLLERQPRPWAIWTADAATGVGKRVWKSGEDLHGSYPDVAGQANLAWTSMGKLVFLSEADNWPHLYSIPAAGGEAKLLTPGAFMVEHIAMGRDGKSVIYSANTGKDPDDNQRRHLYRVSIDGGAPVPLSSGATLEWSPAALSTGVAFIGADAKNPPVVDVMAANGSARRELAGQAPPAEFAGAKFVVPKKVSWKAPDGLTIEGQLFQAPGGKTTPAVIFVHGGSFRQMILGWSYMDYYSNAYAMNQYMAAHGFTVLSVNYRLGIGYGWDFQHWPNGGALGSSEYQDVAAAGRFLQLTPGVDPKRIGIWGGSYGGLLTALALARNSDIFKAGVDFHGVHDWSRTVARQYGARTDRYEKGDLAQAMETAFKASPIADIGTWTSPVLLIQGDDDRNVHFAEMIDLSQRLEAKGVDFEQMVIPDEIHGFLRYASWLKADTATAEYLTRKLGAQPGK